MDPPQVVAFCDYCHPLDGYRNFLRRYHRVFANCDSGWGWMSVVHGAWIAAATAADRGHLEANDDGVSSVVIAFHRR